MSLLRVMLARPSCLEDVLGSAYGLDRPPLNLSETRAFSSPVSENLLASTSETTVKCSHALIWYGAETKEGQGASGQAEMGKSVTFVAMRCSP
jgi:hypothetical protein